MSAIFSNILKAEKWYLHQCKPKDNGSVVLTLIQIINTNYKDGETFLIVCDFLWMARMETSSALVLEKPVIN